MITLSARADILENSCEALEEWGDEVVTISVKYRTRDVRDQVWQMSNPRMHVDFISRVVGDAKADDILKLCDNPDVLDIERIGDNEKDSFLHRLMEVYRVYHYVIGGRFDVAAFNFSQGVRKGAIGKSTSGERTMAEALELVARRTAPVFVAAGNAGEIGLSGYTAGSSVFPVVATQNRGQSLYEPTSSPDETIDKRRLFLFADGAPRQTRSHIDKFPLAVNRTEHLTPGQLLLPEESEIKVGGSSFATFAATPTACLVHQYLQVLNFYMNSSKPVGEVPADPFISYYVDNPISTDFQLLNMRLADRRKKYSPIYAITIENKSRVQNFFFENIVEINLRYSTPILHGFYKFLAPTNLASGFEGHQRYVDFETVFETLRTMTFADWILIAANRRSLYYPRWLDLASKDTDPLLNEETMDRIAGYCKQASLFVILSDQSAVKF